MTTRFHIDSELGSNLVGKITSYLLRVVGINHVYIDITQKVIEVEHNPYIDIEIIKVAIENAGLHVVDVT